MRTEISALFYLQSLKETPVEAACIGSGIWIERLKSEWIDDVRKQCPLMLAREKLEVLSPYTHRFYYELENKESPLDYLPTPEEQELIVRSIVLSRLVKPTSIGFDSVWVKSFYCNNETVKHYHEQYIKNSNIAFVEKGAEAYNTITEADALVMAALWDSFQFLHDATNEPKYRRIVRAIRFHERAYAIESPEISHPVLHAALESMICTGHQHNQAQVTQRLPQLVSFISELQALDIYHTCCDFKHAAQALYQQQISSNGTLAASDQARLNAVILLRRAIRELVVRALRDRSFADELADTNLLRKKYKVFDKKGNLV
jgi:hypothetical protein